MGAVHSICCTSSVSVSVRGAVTGNPETWGQTDWGQIFLSSVPLSNLFNLNRLLLPGL